MEELLCFIRLPLEIRFQICDPQFIQLFFARVSHNGIPLSQLVILLNHPSNTDDLSLAGSLEQRFFDKTSGQGIL